jgi:DNA-binding PadR family transcriptional regulator
MGILALLAEGPSHGYQLKASFEARTGGVWRLNVGQVYTTLERLRSDGLAEPSPDGDEPGSSDRRPWRITRDGKEALEAWFDEPAIEPAPGREEFLVKVLLAVGRSPREALAVIDRQRAELYRLAQRERAARRSAGVDDDLAASLMAELVAARREADLRWLDRCEAAITARPSEGTPS